jgi:hypothetical protein
MHQEPILRTRIGLERLRQIAVDFDDIQTLGALEKPPRQCPAAGADFDDALAGGRCHGVDDPADHPGIMQEVLPESLTDGHGW